MFGISLAFTVCLKLIFELSHRIYCGVCTRNFQFRGFAQVILTSF